MYKLSSEKDTPEKIISDLQNYRISRDEAIKRINFCIETSISEWQQNEEYLTKEDLKDFKEKIADLLWDRYSIPRKGNAKIINETVNQAVMKLGKGKSFYLIKRKYYRELINILWYIV